VGLLVACLWGMVGAASVEGSELYAATRWAKNFPWRLPGELKFGPYLVTVVLRIALGVIAAAVCAEAGPLGAAGAVAAGIAAPKLLEQLGRHAPAVGLASPAEPSAGVSSRRDVGPTAKGPG
jgi:hypothetical protein